MENLAVKKILIDVALNDAVEILAPTRSARLTLCKIVCLCCERADQPMDDDGCGICDACLDAPLQATGNPDGLDFPDAFPHLSLTARHR